MSTDVIVALLVWGVIAGLDLVSVLQAMVGRPLVAATVAGAIAGDPANGVMIGMALELFALEFLPVGGARYPDYGPAAVAAATAAVGLPPGQLGVPLVLGLVLAYVGDWSIVGLRRWNTWRVRRAAGGLDAGDLGTISRVQLGGILWDALRSLALTGAGLGLAWAVRTAPPLDARRGLLLTAVLIGIGLASAAQNALRLADPRRAGWWLALGLAGGTAWVVLR